MSYQIKFELTVNFDNEPEKPLEHDQIIREIEIWAGEINDLPFGVTSVDLQECTESEDSR
jgi:hypothetical protein